MRIFPKLGSKTVRIKGSDWIHVVKRIDIAQVEALDMVVRDTIIPADRLLALGLSCDEILEAGATAFFAVIKACFPENVSSEVSKLGFFELLDLGFHLAYGEDVEPYVLIFDSSNPCLKPTRDEVNA